jgi:hypothetical protein
LIDFFTFPTLPGFSRQGEVRLFHMENIMGWLYFAKTKEQLIDELTSSEENSERRLDVLEYELNGDGDTLWTVTKLTCKGSAEEPKTFITCFLLDASQGKWGYKDMDEGCGPYYYDCPLRFLDMAQHYTCEKRRNLVREWHRKYGVANPAGAVA